jgi:5-methylcytosine-specific restriction endonuclease McrA
MKTVEEKKQYFHDYYEKNKVRISIRGSAYYEKNKEAIDAQHREYAGSHKEELAEAKKEYVGEHKEEIAVYLHDYYLADPEKFKQRARERREADPAAARAYDAAYYLANPKRFQEYRRTHIDEIYMQNEKRRALKFTNTPKDELLTLVQWCEILEQFDYSCAYCGRKMERPTMDHVIPLSRGGAHSKDNIVPACRHCNSSKRSRTPQEWANSRMSP